MRFGVRHLWPRWSDAEQNYVTLDNCSASLHRGHRCLTPNYPRCLENILESELHDPGIQSARDLAERVAVEAGPRIVPAETVGYVERFRTNLDPLRFPD